MGGPTRLRDDAAFRARTGIRIEDDNSLLASHDFGGLKEQTLARIDSGGPAGTDGSGTPGTGGESMTPNATTLGGAGAAPVVAKIGAIVASAGIVATVGLVMLQSGETPPGLERPGAALEQAQAPALGVEQETGIASSDEPGAAAEGAPSQAQPTPAASANEEAAREQRGTEPGPVGSGEEPAAVVGAASAAATQEESTAAAEPGAPGAEPGSVGQGSVPPASEPGSAPAEKKVAMVSPKPAGSGSCAVSLKIPPHYSWDLVVTGDRIEGGGVNLTRSDDGVVYGFIWEHPTRLRVAKNRIYGRIGFWRIDYDVTRGGSRILVREHTGAAAAEESQGGVVVNSPSIAMKVVRDSSGQMKGGAEVRGKQYPAQLDFERCDSKIFRDRPEVLMVLSFFFRRQAVEEYKEVDTYPAKRGQRSTRRRR